MPEIMLLLPLLSLDTLFTGVAYACRGITVPFWSRLVIGLVSGGALCFSVGVFGSLPFLPPVSVKVAACLLLWLIGIKPLLTPWLRRHLHSPMPALLRIFLDETEADNDTSLELSVPEAALLAVTLSADSLFSGVGLEVSIPLPLILLFGSICAMLFFSFGMWAGQRLSRYLRHFQYLSAVCFFLLGLSRLR